MEEPAVSISLSMIVKDEENNLAACLSSVKRHVDEIIIVDTGSSDKTIEIARNFGAKIFHYAWDDDFSSARNFALQQTSGDWVVCLDADHRLEIDPEYNLREYLAVTDELGIFVEERSFYSLTDSLSSDRVLIFKNHKSLKFDGVIHEHPVASITEYAKKTKQVKVFTKIDWCRVYHQLPENPLTKLERDLVILQKAVVKQPENYHNVFKLLITQKNLFKNEEYKSTLLDAILRIEKKNLPFTESIIGIWGQFGEWVIEGTNAENLELFYKKARQINERTKWNDIRLVWPYVKVSILQKKYDKAVTDLTTCITNGIAPDYAPLTREERLTPVYQLIKLINNTQPAGKLVECMGSLDNLLVNSGLTFTQLFQFIQNQDTALISAIKNIAHNNMKIRIDKALESFKSEVGSTEKRPFLSLCMIVKNEAANLRRCLKSVESMVNEIVIVDTGCDDNSIDIANEFNAKVYKFEWMGDFSAARNFGLDHAAGEWILHLDADEEMCPFSINKLISIVQRGNVDGLNVILRNYQPETDIIEYLDEKQVRLFRNTPQHRFRGRVHEQIIPSIAETGGIFKDCDIIINHYGYQANNVQRAKRNLSLLNIELQQNPHDAYVLFKLGETYKALKEWDKANEFLVLALSNPRGTITNEIKEIIYLRLGQIALAQNKYSFAQKYARACLRFNGKNAMAKYILGISMMYMGDVDDAMVLFFELKATQNIHGLDLSDVENLMIMIESSKEEEVLN